MCIVTDADFALSMITDEPKGTTAASHTPPSTSSASDQPAASVSEQPAVSKQSAGSAVEVILKASPIPRCEKPCIKSAQFNPLST